MYLNDEQIIKILEHYIRDERYKQAVLIDGEWGAGKTFFIKEKLMKSLEDDLIDYSVFYITLYGFGKVEQIWDEMYALVYEDFFCSKLGNEQGKKIKKGISLLSKIVTTGVKHFSIDLSELPKLSDLKEIKNAVFIFDDLERCNININQVLGFMNNLVEHDSLKVILIANEKEIGQTEVISDLPQRYMVALDDRLHLSEENDTKINKKQLISRTNKIFSEDTQYKKIREKLIGLTIYYQSDIQDIYDSIIDKYFEKSPAKQELLDRKEIVIDIFQKRECNNIRTLINGLMAYEKFVIILLGISSDYHDYLDEYLKKILIYTMEMSIQLKSGKELQLLKPNSAEAGIVYLGEKVNGEIIIGYKFVDRYLKYRYLNPTDIETCVIRQIELGKEEEKRRELEKKEHEKQELEKMEKKKLSKNILKKWYRLEDDDVYKLLDKLEMELKNEKYFVGDFKDIIVMLMQMEYRGIKDINFDKYIPHMKIYMEKYMDEYVRNFVKEYGEPVGKELIEISTDSQEFLNDYNHIVEPLYKIIEAKGKTQKVEKYKFMNMDQPWDDNFETKCGENHDNFLVERKFLSLMDAEMLTTKMGKSKVNDLYCFIDGIKKVYCFDNLDDYFKEDIYIIKEIIKYINEDELARDNISVTRKIVMEELEKYLQKILMLIER